MKQSDKAKGTLREMKKELDTLRKDVTFREFIGYEMCIKKFKQRYSLFLKRK